MKATSKLLCGAALLAAGGFVVGTANADALPTGWTCTGSCGTDGADGTVTAAPVGDGSYQWVSTDGGIDGVGQVKTQGALNLAKNGSLLQTYLFSATAGTSVDLAFNFITSDGFPGSDYGWAALFDQSGALVTYLFSARGSTNVSNIVPGFGMPAVGATLTPSTSKTSGNSGWSPLGSSSGTCRQFSACGATGWIGSSYTIADAGNYFIGLGVVNWNDEKFDSGVAMAGFDFSPIPSNVPEPASLGVFGFGALLIGGFMVLRRRRTA